MHFNNYVGATCHFPVQQFVCAMANMKQVNIYKHYSASFSLIVLELMHSVQYGMPTQVSRIQQNKRFRTLSEQAAVSLVLFLVAHVHTSLGLVSQEGQQAINVFEIRTQGLHSVVQTRTQNTQEVIICTVKSMCKFLANIQFSKRRTDKYTNYYYILQEHGQSLLNVLEKII